MDVPASYIILDDRKRKDFNKITISKYKRAEVMKSLITALNERKIEEACIWAIELHCSGQHELIWKQFLLYISNSINTSSPYLPVWFWRKFQAFEELQSKYNTNYQIEGRNSQEIRNILSDVISVLLLSTKNTSFDKKKLPKIGIEDFDHNSLSNRIRAKNNYMITNIVSETDSKELQLGLNEFAVCLNSKQISFSNTIYWLQWLLYYEVECKTHNIPISCKGTKIRDIKDKFYKDWIWYVWHIILKETEYKNEDLLSRIVLTLYKIYKHNYSTSTRKAKMVHIYHVVKMLKEHVNWNIPLIHEYSIRVQICANINLLYREIALGSGTEVDQGKLVMLDERREQCRKGLSKHAKKIRNLQREEKIMEEKTKYLKVLKIERQDQLPEPKQYSDQTHQTNNNQNRKQHHGKKMTDYVKPEEEKKFIVI